MRGRWWSGECEKRRLRTGGEMGMLAILLINPTQGTHQLYVATFHSNPGEIADAHRAFRELVQAQNRGHLEVQCSSLILAHSPRADMFSCVNIGTLVRTKMLVLVFYLCSDAGCT